MSLGNSDLSYTLIFLNRTTVKKDVMSCNLEMKKLLANQNIEIRQYILSGLSAQEAGKAYKEFMQNSVDVCKMFKQILEEEKAQLDRAKIELSSTRLATLPPFVEPSINTSSKAGDLHEGFVLQSLDVGMYSLIQIDVGGSSIWLAVSKIAVNSGDHVRWGDSALLEDFPSKTLNRTFKELFFVNELGVVK